MCHVVWGISYSDKYTLCTGYMSDDRLYTALGIVCVL